MAEYVILTLQYTFHYCCIWSGEGNDTIRCILFMIIFYALIDNYIDVIIYSF